jgi:hypothetical protein
MFCIVTVITRESTAIEEFCALELGNCNTSFFNKVNRVCRALELQGSRNCKTNSIIVLKDVPGTLCNCVFLEVFVVCRGY